MKKFKEGILGRRISISEDQTKHKEEGWEGAEGAGSSRDTRSHCSQDLGSSLGLAMSLLGCLEQVPALLGLSFPIGTVGRQGWMLCQGSLVPFSSLSWPVQGTQIVIFGEATFPGPLPGPFWDCREERHWCPSLLSVPWQRVRDTQCSVTLGESHTLSLGPFLHGTASHWLGPKTLTAGRVAGGGDACIAKECVYFPHVLEGN